MTAHIHRWRIEEVNGTPHVAGQCRECGAERRFPASSEYDATALSMSTVSFERRDTAEKLARDRERLVEARRRSGEISTRRAAERRARA